MVVTMVVVADGAVVGSPDVAMSESKIATVRMTVGARRCSSPLPLPQRRPFRRGGGDGLGGPATKEVMMKPQEPWPWPRQHWPLSFPLVWYNELPGI